MEDGRRREPAGVEVGNAEDVLDPQTDRERIDTDGADREAPDEYSFAYDEARHDCDAMNRQVITRTYVMPP